MASIDIGRTPQEQESIKEWFDNVYKRRGFNYLRPMDAYKVFFTAMNAKKGDKYLDVACGPGMMLKIAEDNGIDAHGIDIAPNAVEMAKEHLRNADVRVGNAESLPYKDKSFDLVSTIGALERMLNLPAVLKEQQRVAKDDATFCYFVRNSDTLLWKVKMFFNLRNKQGHQGAQSLDQWKQTFLDNGYKVKAVHKDTWQWWKWLRYLTLGGKFLDYYKIRNIPIPLKYCFEFVFVLEKASK